MRIEQIALSKIFSSPIFALARIASSASRWRAVSRPVVAMRAVVA